MEPDVREFLKRISYSIGVAFVWLAILCIAAIKGDNAFIQEKITLANVLFYLWAIASTIALIIIVRKLWTFKA